MPNSQSHDGIEVTTQITFRHAVQNDCAQLALFADMASRRLLSHLWGLEALAGQSVFEVGRNDILNNTTRFSHYRNWLIAEYAGQHAGGLLCYEVKPESIQDDTSETAIKPIAVLKRSTVGCWHISTAAVFSEFRGNGIGRAMLARAESDAQRRNLPTLSLTVCSFNTAAISLYQRQGFTEWSREPFVPFDGSETDADWILMAKIVEPQR